MLPLLFIALGVGICVVAVVLLKRSNTHSSTSPATAINSQNAHICPDSAQNHFDPPIATRKHRYILEDDNDSLPPWALNQPTLSALSHELPTTPAPPPEIYSSTTPMFDLDLAKLRAEIEGVLAKSKRPLPTQSQWQMILSASRSIRVIAGAGSGKSTTLSLRVVLMHKYLGIPLEHISVVTFTRASRADMVKKLAGDMRSFGVDISESTARRVVRTFHSMILGQASAASDMKFIEHIGSEADSGDVADDLGSLNPRQLDYLRKIYADTYHSNPTFRRNIGLVLLEKISSVRQMRYSDTENLERAMAVAEPRDLAVTQAVTDAWLAKESINPRIGAISWEPTPIVCSRGEWHANGRILSNNMPIVLGCGGIPNLAKLPIDTRKYPIGENDKDRTLGFLTNVRLKVMATVATERYLYIETDDDLRDLFTYLDWVQPEGVHLRNKDTFPAFSIRLPGDSSSASIFESLYNLGTFVASMGLSVQPTAADLALAMSNEDCPLESYMCASLRDFWPALHQGDHSTYNELFLSYGNTDQAKNLPTEVMLPMKHLLVDEFQDISGQIIKWIKSIHTVLHGRGEHPSLMVVGDDWQSVYGWRGSDPEYLIHFDEHFGKSNLVVMNENYRSGQHIINTAETLVGFLKESAIKKHGVSSGLASGSLGSVELSYGDDKSIQALIDKIRLREPDSTVFILSRTNEGLAPFRKYSKDSKISLLTMHRAKGLEADHVIIKGDCAYSGTSHIKNAIYGQAGLATSYDEAQQDEALRLAYVAITRAKKKAYWFGEPVKPDGAFLKLAQATGAAKPV